VNARDGRIRETVVSKKNKISGGRRSMRNTDSFMLIRKRGKELGKEYGQQLN
jgi:hypothetical protein